MTRARLPEATVAAAACTAALWPLTPLFDSLAWVVPAIMLAGAVLATGLGARSVGASPMVTIATQSLVLVIAWVGTTASAYLWFGLPGPQFAQWVSTMGAQAVEVIRTSSPPAPLNPGLLALLPLVVAGIVGTVDALMVTLRQPWWGGAALVGAYLIPASNSAGGLTPLAFLLPAALWVLLLQGHVTAGARGWVTVDSSPGRDAARSLNRWSAGLLVVALGAAVAIPAVAAGRSPRFLFDGLGRADGQSGDGPGIVELTSSADLSASLGDRSEDPVLTYRTTGRPEPLRVGVLSFYFSGLWVDSLVPQSSISRNDLPSYLAPDPELVTSELEFTVSENRLAPPQIALPNNLVSLDLPDGVGWEVDLDGVVSIEAGADQYQAGYAAVDIPDDQYSQILGIPPVNGVSDQGMPADETLIEEVMADVRATTTVTGDRPVDLARAIQEYLRGPSFTYSTEVPVPESQEDPLETFLATRTGYCIHFATAMVMLARSQGIPARFAIGFLPGRLRAGEYEVLASDAHAWPELYLAPVGWVRFEPTPGVRSGSAPAWSAPEGPDDPDAASQPSSSASASAAAPQRPDIDPGDGSEAVVTDRGWWQGLRATSWVQRALALLIALLGVAATVPLAATVTRRRRWKHARDDVDRTEAAWTDLQDRLVDLRVRVPRRVSPRRAGTMLRAELFLGQAALAALGRVVESVERARYASSGAQPDLRSDVETIVRAAQVTRRWPDRLRAALWPLAGRRAWRRVWSRVVSRGSREAPASETGDAASTSSSTRSDESVRV